MELNRELTERVFLAKSVDDLKVVIGEFPDLVGCSRLALDRALLNLFNKRCSGNKDFAIRMLKGAIDGVDVPDVSRSAIFSSSSKNISLEDRSELIKSRVEKLIESSENYLEYLKFFKRDRELKALEASEDDICFSVLSSEIAICGKDHDSKARYIMRRTKEYIDNALSEGDTLYFNPEEVKS